MVPDEIPDKSVFCQIVEPVVVSVLILGYGMKCGLEQTSEFYNSMDDSSYISILFPVFLLMQVTVNLYTMFYFFNAAHVTV